MALRSDSGAPSRETGLLETGLRAGVPCVPPAVGQAARAGRLEKTLPHRSVRIVSRQLTPFGTFELRKFLSSPDVDLAAGRGRLCTK